MGESGKPREQLAQTPTRQHAVGTFQKIIFGNRKYLSLPCSGKRSKGDIGGKSCRDALGLLLSFVVDPVAVKGRRVVNGHVQVEW